MGIPFSEDEVKLLAVILVVRDFLDKVLLSFVVKSLGIAPLGSHPRDAVGPLFIFFDEFLDQFSVTLGGGGGGDLGEKRFGVEGGVDFGLSLGVEGADAGKNEGGEGGLHHGFVLFINYILTYFEQILKPLIKS